MKSLIFSLILLSATMVEAKGAFQTDPLLLDTENLCVVSSFQERDYCTVYSPKGIALWEMAFRSKILSWKLADGMLFVFSKDRNDQAYYLSCLDAISGVLNWESPIYAPSNIDEEAP